MLPGLQLKYLGNKMQDPPDDFHSMPVGSMHALMFAAPTPELLNLCAAPTRDPRSLQHREGLGSARHYDLVAAG